MAEEAQEKSRGLTFAEQQLARHGWEKGKGLGRDENGICEAIKVKVKCDKGGVGHKESEQFTFHWWDHVFNKASSSLAVESGKDGVLVKKVEGAEEGMITNKKPRKAMLNKSALYGCFVKSATLLSGQEQPECRTSCVEDSSSSEDEEKLDLSSTTRLSDAELVKACGGRTAHKGARHGLTMSAKLARLEQQEQEFMAKYGKKLAGSPPRSKDPSHPTTPSPASDREPAGKTKHKKTKKKKKEQGSSEPSESHAQLPSMHHDEEAARKQKKRSKENVATDSVDLPGAVVDNEEKVHAKPKEKKRRRRLEKIGEFGEEQNGNSRLVLDEDHTGSLQQCECTTATEPHEGAASPLEGDCVPKKEKRKKKRVLQMASQEGALEENGVGVGECYGPVRQVEGSVVLQPAHDGVSKSKKKRSCRTDTKEALAKELDTLRSGEASSADTSNKTEDVEMAAGVEKSQRKKRKRCRGEEQECGTLNGSLEQPVERKKKKKYAN